MNNLPFREVQFKLLLPGNRQGRAFDDAIWVGTIQNELAPGELGIGIGIVRIAGILGIAEIAE